MNEVLDVQIPRSKSSVVSLDKKRTSKGSIIQKEVKNCVDKLNKSLERVGKQMDTRKSSKCYDSN